MRGVIDLAESPPPLAGTFSFWATRLCYIAGRGTLRSDDRRELRSECSFHSSLRNEEHITGSDILSKEHTCACGPSAGRTG